jgi:Fic-DOC domain mobile mystery protein B
LSEPADVTPLDPDEAEGLRLSYVATRAELNAAEAENIAAGLRWAARQRLNPHQLLDDLFLRELHRQMFSSVWRWAGRYRKTEKNIGVEPTAIAVAVRDLVGDALVWVTAVDSPSAWSSDEIAVRFHHRLVSIHPFPNGNGRHSRASADLLLTTLAVEPFTWGRSNLSEPNEVRDRYLASLRAADGGDFTPLLAFARS